MKKEDKIIYFNGNIMPLSEVKISPYDLGFLRGFGGFDVIRTTREGKKIFLLDYHYQRLQKLSKRLNIEIPFSKEEFKDLINTLLEKNNLERSNIRVVITGGVSSNILVQDGDPTVLILLEDFYLPNKEENEKGVNLKSIEFKREIPDIKTTNYFESIYHQDIKEKYFEILYVKDNVVYECSTSNIFMVKDGKIFTPKDGVLPGTTKLFILDILKEEGIDFEEKEISYDFLLECDEVFITATSKDVLPVVEIDDKEIGNGKAGDMTKKLQGMFDEYEKNYKF